MFPIFLWGRRWRLFFFLSDDHIIPETYWIRRIKLFLLSRMFYLDSEYRHLSKSLLFEVYGFSLYKHS